jgi:hypothetical protein
VKKELVEIKMEVAVLLGWIHYEGDVLLGVYASREDAVAAARVKFAAACESYEETQYDGYLIEYRTLGGKATPGFLHAEVEREDITEQATEVV